MTMIDLKNLPDERYDNFIILEEPVEFAELFNERDIELVQLHCIDECNDGSIVGFCGVCKWINNELIPLDGDCYYDSMLVYGYSEFDDGIDILVDEW